METIQGLKRTHKCGELSAKNIGEEVVLMGFTNSVRNLGGVNFINLRDISGIVQDYTENNAKYLMYGEDSNLVTKSETITSNLAYTQVSNVVYKKTVLPVKTVLSSDMASL